MMSVIIYIIAGMIFGAALGALCMFFYMQRRGGELHSQMQDRFKLTAQEAVQQAHESFLKLAQERLGNAQKDGAYELERRQKAIEEMVKPVHENLKALSGAVDQSKGMYQALHEDLKNLGKETSKLAGALRNPAARGNWGEGILVRLLENSGLIKNVHYTLQTTLQGEEGRLRPDAIINLPESLHIVIDAKAPINDFIRDLDEDMDEGGYKNLQTGLAQAVKGHIQQLSKRAYWEQLNSPDFVVLFLPSEHLFSAAIQADPSLLDLAADKKIVLASPILTMSLLRVVGMSWRQIELAQNAQEISAQGSELYKRLLTFTSHIEKVGKNLQNAMSGYDAAIGSLEKSVLPAARKMNELQGHSGDALPSFDAVERQPRLLSLSAEDEEQKKRA